MYFWFTQVCPKSPALCLKRTCFCLPCLALSGVHVHVSRGPFSAKWLANWLFPGGSQTMRTFPVVINEMFYNVFSAHDLCTVHSERWTK